MRNGLPARVSDARSNPNEQIDHAVSTLGRSKHRRQVFEAVYYHKSRVKSADQIATMTGLPRIRVLQEANALAAKQIIGKVQEKGQLIAYEQDSFYQANKREILRLLDDKKKREAYSTKRRPSSTITVNLHSGTRGAKAHFVTIDDISSFAGVRNIAPTTAAAKLSEAAFKRGLQNIIGENGTFTDWGGEQNDLFTTWIRIAGRRRRAAFALKGPGAKGKMTLRHLGKNADQIPRLFQSPADVFFVQYHDEIDQMVVAEMQVHARELARNESRAVWFGVIDGQDSKRLVAAYPNAFE
jgi:hypothetical protein